MSINKTIEARSLARLAPVVFDLARDCRLLCAFAEARGEGRDNLDS